jgi:hypothetical protein
MNKTIVGLGIGLALVGFLLATTGVDRREAPADEDSRAVSGTQAPRLAYEQRFEDLTVVYGAHNDGT